MESTVSLGSTKARGESSRSWVDPQLHAAVLDRKLVVEGADAESVARAGMCLKRW